MRPSLVCLASILLAAGCGSSQTSTVPGHDAALTGHDGAVHDAPVADVARDTGLDALRDAGKATPDAVAPAAEAGLDAPVHVDAARKEAGPPPGEDAAIGEGPYGAAGPATVTTSSISVTTSSGSTFTVIAYIPSTAGLHPVVILSSGFVQTAAGYAPYAERLGSWGIVSILRDNPGLNEAAPAIADDVSYLVTTWLAAQNAAGAGPLSGKLDVSRVGLAGHSEGGQVSLLAAEGGALGKVKGVFGLDPVDTSMNGSVEARTAIATIGVPVAFIGETTDSTGGVGGMPCAPAADNYEVLYGAASSPAVAITAINADHTMFEDPASCTFCTFCTAGTATPATVLAYSVRYLTAFFARELLGDATVGNKFQGAGSSTDLMMGLISVQAK